jgi:hypothetical protein
LRPINEKIKKTAAFLEAFAIISLLNPGVGRKTELDMKKTWAVALPLVVVLAAGSAAAVLWSHPRAGASPGTNASTGGGGTVPERALAAYKSGHYKDALPLFNQWAVSTNGDKKALQVPVAYIQDINERLQALNATGSLPPKPPLDQASVLAAAEKLAADQAANMAASPVERVPHKQPAPGEVVELTIKELGNFSFDPDKDADVPADVKLMDGAKVRLNGYMMPISQTEKITEFALMPSLVGCCFGQPPGPEHIISCTTPPDKAVDYEMDELVVEGTLHVKVKRQDNYTSEIFQLDVRSARVKE